MIMVATIDELIEREARYINANTDYTFREAVSCLRHCMDALVKTGVEEERAFEHSAQLLELAAEMAPSMRMGLMPAVRSILVRKPEEIHELLDFT